MQLFLALFMAYLVGSISAGYIFGRYKKIDLRKFGSGNVGATNVLRAVGKLAAFFTLVIDVFKGYIVVTILGDMLYSFRMNVNYPEYIIAMAFCVVIGHNWPLFLDFKGGKGIATSAGVLLGLCPKLLLVGLCVWLLVFIFSKIVSLSSLISAIAIPFASYLYPYDGSIRFLTAVLAIMTIIRHRANIKRLLRNEEKRMYVKI